MTAGEVLTLLRLEAAAFRQQLANADDDLVLPFLEGLARQELLVEEARSAGLRPSQERVDTLLADAVDQLRSASRRLGLFEVEPAPGEPRELAIARAVEEALLDNLTGATEFVPLGLVSFQLRDDASYAIYDAGIGEAIVRIGQLRASRAFAPTEVPSVPDTLGPRPELPRP